MNNINLKEFAVRVWKRYGDLCRICADALERDKTNRTVVLFEKGYNIEISFQKGPAEVRINQCGICRIIAKMHGYLKSSDDFTKELEALAVFLERPLFFKATSEDLFRAMVETARDEETCCHSNRLIDILSLIRNASYCSDIIRLISKTLEEWDFKSEILVPWRGRCFVHTTLKRIFLDGYYFQGTADKLWDFVVEIKGKINNPYLRKTEMSEKAQNVWRMLTIIQNKIKGSVAYGRNFTMRIVGGCENDNNNIVHFIKIIRHSIDEVNIPTISNDQIVDIVVNNHGPEIPELYKNAENDIVICSRLADTVWFDKMHPTDDESIRSALVTVTVELLRDQLIDWVNKSPLPQQRAFVSPERR